MAIEYSVEVCNTLKKEFRDAELHRPMRVAQYDEGNEIVYDVKAVSDGSPGKVRVAEKFVGGGFAGQVYRVRILKIESRSGSINGLEVGKAYAMKILIPPTGFSCFFRNALYWIGFQGPYQPQVNPAAARAGARPAFMVPEPLAALIASSMSASPPPMTVTT